MIQTEEETKSALVVEVLEERLDDWKVDRMTSEAKSLLESLGITMKGSVSYNIRSVDRATLIGSGQCEDVLSHALFFDVDIVFFDTTLSPRNARNLEAILNLPVIDRNELIIEIFASRARSREARLQVALARAQYLLPRLRQSNIVYSQQRGGVRGAKGEGERQIELDRRQLQGQITRLKREIENVKSSRKTQRKKRLSSTAVTFALVGYTNSGKSSMLNALTGSDAHCEDRLFATLDPLERTISLDSGLETVVADTVGFVSRLPHTLIDAFSSTLEEARLADILILILDSSSPDIDENYSTTLSVLGELEALDKPMIIVFNKADLNAGDEIAMASIASGKEHVVRTSTKTGEGIGELRREMRRLALEMTGASEIIVSLDDASTIERIHSTCRILSAEYGEKSVRFLVGKTENRNWQS